MSITQWFSDAFNGRVGGLTDKQYAAKREKDLRAKQEADTAIVAKRAGAAKQRAAATARTVAVNAEYQNARNTRVDKLTARDRALIHAGHSLVNTPTATWDDSPAQEKPVRSAQKKGGKSTNSAKPTVKPEFPKPSKETQEPGLEGKVNQQNRIITDGVSSTQIFDINSFRSEIINNDVLPSHSYLVTFSPFRTGFPENKTLNNFVQNKRNTLMMRCESIILPTPSLLEEENIRRYGYGPVEKIPYGVQFSDVSMTWLVDKKSEIINFMHQWMNTIVMHDSPSTNMSRRAFRKGLDGYNPFEVGYKDGYANPVVRIYVYNRQNETVTEYEMYDVFPMNIQSMNLGWADENQVQKLTVNFAYTNMRVRAPQRADITQANFITEGISSPYEERQQPNNKGGKAAADAAASPLDEKITSTTNAGKPNATTEYRYFNGIIDDFGNIVEVPTPVTPTPVTRELTT